MNRIEKEIKLLLEMAAAGRLPGYTCSNTENTFFADCTAETGLEEYFSGENDAVARRLEVLWAHEPEMQGCIPLILAVLEKSRGHENHAVVQTELYNYTM